jgi:hypothetical protein
MDKKGFGRISIIFFSLVFVMLWALFFAPIISFWGHQIVVNGGYSGVEALGFNNINFIIGLVFFAFIMFVGFGGGGE